MRGFDSVFLILHYLYRKSISCESVMGKRVLTTALLCNLNLPRNPYKREFYILIVHHIYKSPLVKRLARSPKQGLLTLFTHRDACPLGLVSSD